MYQSVSEWGCQKISRFGRNQVKAQFHMQTGFIFLFYCRTVSLKTDEEKCQFCDSFVPKLKFFGQFHETVILA